MPRSSKSKSHKQSKHSSKEAREYSDSEGDVKMKDKSIKEESSARASKDLAHSASGDKRKFSSQTREGKDGKDLSTHVNGEVPEEYVSSKRRKEKVEGSGGSDRWNGGVDESVDGRLVEKEGKGGKPASSKTDPDKGLRQKEAKGSGESRSKSSKKHEIGGAGEKKEEIPASGVEKEDSKSGKSSESKRKPEIDSVRKESTNVKERDHGSERERKRETDTEKKLRSQAGDVGEEKQGKRHKEHTDRSMRSEVRQSDLDRDTEKKMRKRSDGSAGRDKYDEDQIEIDEKQLSSRGGERTKDERHRDSKHKDGGYRDKHREDGDRDERHTKDEKYEAEKDRRRREDKYREDGHSSRDNRHKDGKYRDDGDRDNRYREEKYHQHEDRDNRHKGGYRVDVERDSRHRDDKNREDNERDGDEKYLPEDKNKDINRRDDRYREDGDEDRHRDNKYGDDVERDDRHKDKKQHMEDFEKVSMHHREGKHGEESDKEKRLREAKYTDEHTQRDRSGDRSDAKFSKDETHITDSLSKKGGVHENTSPNYDDRAPRFKDDQGRRRTDDKEDRSDSRFQNSKDQYDLEKRSGTVARADLGSDRVKSSSRNSDLERTSNHNRRSSPSSAPYISRDHYRQSKQEGSKYRDHAYEDRARRSRDYSGSAGTVDKISSTRSAEKAIQKDDNYLIDGSAERRLKSDSRNSSIQVVDKSPSSTSNDRRHLGRSEVKRSLDIEDFALRSGSKDAAKDFSGKEGRGNRDPPMDAFAGHEPGHQDGDTLSVSSPFIRGGSHVSGGSTRLPPPLPFRQGIDSPSVISSSEDDFRAKPGSRHRRVGGGESNVGRFQGNSWRGVPSWPSPVGNGFIFQHAPPHVSFPPVMQQFPAPPMFGVRPSMDLNHPGLPYHMPPDADRFSNHGRPIGWRTPMDSSCSPFHSWDSNNSVLGDEANIYGRPEWDQYRNLPMNRNWEHTSDLWKVGPNRSASLEMQSASHKEAHSGQGPGGDESLTCQSGQQSQSEQKHADLEVESNAFIQSSDPTENKNIPEDLRILPQEPCINDSKLSRKDDSCFCLAYLAKLDISADLTEPDLYEQCKSLLLSDDTMVADVDVPIRLYLEPQEEGKIAAANRLSWTSLLPAASDSVFEKAMSLYKEQRADVNVFINIQRKSSVALDDKGKDSSEDVFADGLEARQMHPNSDEGVMQVSPETKVEGSKIFTHHHPVIEGLVERISMVVDIAEENGDKAVTKPTAIVEGEGGPCDELLPDVTEDLTTKMGKPLGNHSPKSDPHLLCPAEAFEVVVPVESESVIFSRIHHSPESTH
ncbi:unnamed protein product [Cuscuta europaea]|uniref:Uncharacterized protein n=1 Tax=Cuscuta europaea TaxID=41803 RepID=A0A9P0ZNL1_CUSEU|nr:unnamed protein product [Cuscuta europaea]